MLSGLTKAILEGFATRVIEGIKENIRSKQVTEFGAMNASGKMAESLGYRLSNDELVIFSSEKFFTVLETGRGPTSPGATKGNPTVRENILEWITVKGINPTDISKESLAYLISRKIHQEGSLLFRQGGKSGVISDYINEQYIRENLINLLNDSFRDYVINEFLKKSAAS